MIDAYVHAEYTSTEKICRGVGEFAVDNNLVLNFHMSETKLETEECKTRHNGLTPAAYFNEVGMLDAKTNIAHAV